MFYPNKTSLANSILTIFFNRLGDVLLIIGLSLALTNYREFMELSFSAPELRILLVLCAFSKRAQFPLSRWLPAAISAPTPISAIVHSSTLVTAGIFLLTKLELFLEKTYFFLPLSVRVLTFFLGGLLARHEKDLKKVVAFSTISQISMIIRFCFYLRL